MTGGKSISSSVYLRQIAIGDTVTKNNIFLAPMAGGSEPAFRIICSRLGAGFVCTELVTARGIKYKGNVVSNYRYLRISPEEYPVAIQLFGSTPDDFLRAIDIIFKYPDLSGCSAIDINMGCPVKKVVKTGAGSTLMADIPRASEIIKAAVRSSPVPITVKFRKGIDEKNVNAVEFAKMCEDSGASLITVHGRTATQMYSGRADWNIIRDVKSAVRIPVIGNGDISGPDSAIAMFEQTEVDGIMIGRAALGNPWIFNEIIENLKLAETGQRFEGGLKFVPTITERIDVIREHIDRSIDYLGELLAIKEMRKHFSWYLKGIPNSSSVKAKLVLCNSREECLLVLSDLLTRI